MYKKYTQTESDNDDDRRKKKQLISFYCLSSCVDGTIKNPTKQKSHYPLNELETKRENDSVFVCVREKRDR